MSNDEWKVLGRLPAKNRHEAHYLEYREGEIRIHTRYHLTAFRAWRDEPTPLNLAAALPTCTPKEK